MKAGASLADILADPTAAFSYKVEDTAFNRAIGTSFFDIRASEEKRERFDKAMIGWTELSSGSSLQQGA
ncbi:hypothetical protein VKT23_019462 [Stygiomarasmius scandens]|uniref:Uncharacterized protein n=1 Tax=Marasmiellus scandens TaxID=2682957 RepID=A0ABR1INM7_9AGAR